MRRLPAAEPLGGPGITGAARDEAEPAAVARRRGTPVRALFFGVIVLAILAGALWALLGSSLLVVRHVDVTGNRLVPAAQVRAAARIRAGEPLARVNTTAVAQRVERIAVVLSARVTRSWPNTIVITVRERTPQLAVSARGGYDLVDQHGVTVRWTAHKPAGLPLLSAPPTVMPGSSRVLAAALVVRQLPSQLRGRLLSVSATSAAAVTLRLNDGVTVLWGGVGHATQKWAELELLFKTRAHFYDVSDPGTAVTQG